MHTPKLSPLWCTSHEIQVALSLNDLTAVCAARFDTTRRITCARRLSRCLSLWRGPKTGPLFTKIPTDSYTVRAQCEWKGSRAISANLSTSAPAKVTCCCATMNVRHPLRFAALCLSAHACECRAGMCCAWVVVVPCVGVLRHHLETQTRVVCQYMQVMQPTALRSVPHLRLRRVRLLSPPRCPHNLATACSRPYKTNQPRAREQTPSSASLLLHSLPQNSLFASRLGLTVTRATHSHNTPACLFVVVPTLQTTRRISLRVAVQQVRSGRGRCWVSRVLQAVSIHSACLVLPSGSKRARSGPWSSHRLSRLSHALALK
jgi:hypothetical protein